MSAELVDPFATPERPVWSDQALNEMVEGICYWIVWTKREDPAELSRDLVRKAVHELRHAPDRAWAGEVLEHLWHRAETGAAYSWSDEPREPAWSLDSDRSEHFIRHVDDVVDDL